MSADLRARCTHVAPIDTDRARVIVVRCLTPGVAGMTLGRWVFIRRGHEHNADLLAHELVHVEQWRTLGPIRFLVRYLGEYSRGRRRGMRHGEAYRAISLEVDARDRSGA